MSIDQGQVKAVSFAPMMLNKGHTVTEPDGPLWVRLACLYGPFDTHHIRCAELERLRLSSAISYRCS